MVLWRDCYTGVFIEDGIKHIKRSTHVTFVLMYATAFAIICIIRNITIIIIAIVIAYRIIEERSRLNINTSATGIITLTDIICQQRIIACTYQQIDASTIVVLSTSVHILNKEASYYLWSLSVAVATATTSTMCRQGAIIHYDTVF